MRNGKGLEFPEGWGGGKGEPGVPPRHCWNIRNNYPLGTQKIITVFFIKKSYDGKGKELEFPEGPEGPGSAKRILMTVGSP